MQDIHKFGVSSFAYGINDSGQVVGVYRDSNERVYGFIWDNINSMQDLGGLSPTVQYTLAYSINNLGQVVGESFAGSDVHAFIWDNLHHMRDLGTLGGSASVADAINNRGQVVGFSRTSTGQTHVFLINPIDMDKDGIPDTWNRDDNHDGKNDLMQDVGLLANNIGWSVDGFASINDGGQMAGTGINGGIRQALIADTNGPVLIIPGIVGTLPTNSDFGNWLLNRGVSPDTLRVEPLGNTYDALIQTLKNAGYTEGKDLFVANYDWRMPPAPTFDGQADGVIGGLTAQGLIQDVTSGKYYSGVDYLAYWLKKASDAWAASHGGVRPDSVDVIAHSTGGLVARAYIQSTAYNGVYGQDSQGHDLKLPKIGNFVMLDVPNEGASKAWNPLFDNFSIDAIYEHVLAPIIEVAFNKLRNGHTIHGPDGDIHLDTITRPDETLDKAKFVALYVPTVLSLLATYSFTTNFSIPPEDQNTLLLDLNAGSAPNTFPDKVGKVFNVYGAGVLTPQSVTKLVGDGQDHGDRIFSFTDAFERTPRQGETYYRDNQDMDGDGTVPLVSLVGPFAESTQLENQPFDKRLGALGEVDHTGIVSNPFVQKRILDDLGVKIDTSQIATSHQTLWNLPSIVRVRFDPVEGMLTDGQGRRLGFTTSTGPLAEIPNSFYLGQTDGIGFIFGPVVVPLTLDLTGLGEDYSVRVVGVQGDNIADLSVSGTLAAGEHQNFVVTFAPPMTDTLPPTTTAALSGPLGNNGWYDGSVTVALAATDDLSGVATTQYRLDGGAWQVYIGAFQVATDGVHSVDFYSIDNAGNVEDTHTQTIKVDQSNPVLTATANRSVVWPPNGKMVPVTVSGEMNDIVSGIDSTQAAYTVQDEYGLIQPHGAITLQPDGSYSFTILLEARRDGQDKDGRQYTVSVTGRDLARNGGTATVVVTVPHDQGKAGVAAASNSTNRFGRSGVMTSDPIGPFTSVVPPGPLGLLSATTTRKHHRSLPLLPSLRNTRRDPGVPAGHGWRVAAVVEDGRVVHG